MLNKEKSNYTINYSMLNDILFPFYRNYDVYTYYKSLKKVIKLCNLLTKKQINNKKNITFKYIDINDSIKIVNDFLNITNKEYKEIFQNILYEKDGLEPTISFSYNNKGSYINRDGKLNISLNNTIEDTFSILHEFTHKLSMSSNQNSIINYIYSEIPSITMEFLLRDYLYNNSLVNKKEINTKLITRYNNTYYSAIEILFEKELLDIYENKNIIDIDIYKLGNKYKELYNYNINRGIKNILYSNELLFPYEQRYVIGLLGSIDLYDSIKNNSKEDLFILIKNLGNSEYEEKNTIKNLNNLDTILLKNIKINKPINYKNKQLKYLSNKYNRSYNKTFYNFIIN